MPKRTEAPVNAQRPNFLRQGRFLAHRLFQRLTLSQRFLIVAVVVVALAMLGLGSWVGESLRASTTKGVATAAADSIESLIAHQISGVNLERPMSDKDQAALNDIFEIGNDASAPRLLQIRLYDLEGNVLYESAGALAAPSSPDSVTAAIANGTLTASISSLTLPPVGPVQAHPIEVLQIFAPLHQQSTDTVIALAELFYGARSLLLIEQSAQEDVWALVGLIGVGVTGVLFLLVDRASRTIASQRAHLAQNLLASRKLSEENRALHAASEALRMGANLANENLLAYVGSDIHDGPIQLLTLIILRLTRAKDRASDGAAPMQPDLEATVTLATKAIEDLRNISTGLVLPELEALTLDASVRLAVSRHEALTGTSVGCECRDLPPDASTEVKTCVYRIIQEALNNAFRHGDPVGQVVKASADDGELSIEISNRVDPANGAAIETPEQQKLGLRGMQFRAESLGGTLSLDLASLPVATISARIPYGSVRASSASSMRGPLPS
jgi:signal transduction histidine kinase